MIADMSLRLPTALNSRRSLEQTAIYFAAVGAVLQACSTTAASPRVQVSAGST